MSSGKDKILSSGEGLSTNMSLFSYNIQSCLRKKHLWDICIHNMAKSPKKNNKLNPSNYNQHHRTNQHNINKISDKLNRDK